MRPRKRLNKTLPPNLYLSKKGKNYYFSYRHPVTGKHFGMGSDRAKAVRAANELNARLIPSETDLVARVIGGQHLMSNWLDDYLFLYEGRKVKGNAMSPETIRARRTQVEKIRNRFGDKDIAIITTKDVSDYLDTLADIPHQARLVRAALNDIFRVAITKGKLSTNPVTPTRLQGATVHRSRLSFDEFMTILDEADPWVKKSMYLAILTGQRISDIRKMQFKDIEDGYLHIHQKKSGSLVRLSLELRLKCIDMTIGDAVSLCRDNVVSRYLIHHVKNHPRASKGSSMDVRTISGGFAEARDRTGLTWSKPPSFHEMRSLSGRLYGEQGGIDVQNLLGHKDAKTTALYVDPRGSEWISVG